MSDALLHASEPGSPRRQENVASSRRRGRRRGVEIRPGSVKQARPESGLSLGQVARNDISRTAIYFVETGKAKPSIETLRLIAERTNKPLDFFLGQSGGVSVDPAAALVEIERLIATGDPAAAVEAADRLVAATSDARVAAHARVHLSLAHIRLGHPVRARSHASAQRTESPRAIAARGQSVEIRSTSEYLSHWSAPDPTLARNS